MSLEGLTHEEVVKRAKRKIGELHVRMYKLRAELDLIRKRQAEIQQELLKLKKDITALDDTIHETQVALHTALLNSKVVRGLKVRCPGLLESIECSDGNRRPLYAAIIWLNDTLGWSREAIADWLESLEIDLAVE